jgi:two-component system chemotaxis sensor kinase CheA
MLLLVKVQGDQRMAIPLSIVARLEEFQHDSVEMSGGHAVVQYRGQIMPLVNVADFIGRERPRERKERDHARPVTSEAIQVIVYSHENHNIGLRVDQILDVVEERVEPQKAGARPGVLGTAIIKEKVTGLLDVDSVVRAAAQLEPVQAA